MFRAQAAGDPRHLLPATVLVTCHAKLISLGHGALATLGAAMVTGDLVIAAWTS